MGTPSIEASEESIKVRLVVYYDRVRQRPHLHPFLYLPTDRLGLDLIPL